MMSSLNLLIVVAVLLISLCYHLFWYLIEPDIESLCEIEAKPVIYGEEQCESIFKRGIYVTESALVTIFVTFFSPKIIIRGRLDGKPIYLKKLATENEMKATEKLFKIAFKNFKLDKKLIPFIVENINELSYENGWEVHKLQICPRGTDIRKLLGHLPNFTTYDVHQYLNIWTSFQANPEPILLKILQEPEWPVPRYYGSCGRLVIVEDCGKIVTDHIDSSWSLRANISIQILTAAYKFTFDHPELAFYLTDFSPDNIAVNEDGKVKFIDLEHVIVVDKHPPFADPEWYTNHTAKNMECTNCFSVSSGSICNHWISDHNIFAACREILHDTSILIKGGLLHDIPADVPSSRLQNLLHECVNSKSGISRFQVGTQIIDLLNTV